MTWKQHKTNIKCFYWGYGEEVSTQHYTSIWCWANLANIIEMTLGMPTDSFLQLLTSLCTQCFLSSFFLSDIPTSWYHLLNLNPLHHRDLGDRQSISISFSVPSEENSLSLPFLSICFSLSVSLTLVLSY